MQIITIEPFKHYPLVLHLPNGWTQFVVPPGHQSETRCLLQIVPLRDSGARIADVDLHINSGFLQISYGTGRGIGVLITDSRGTLLRITQSLNIEKYLKFGVAGSSITVQVDPEERNNVE